MQNPSGRQIEAEEIYWKSRVAGLELIVCELLTNNQRLREELQGSRPRTGVPTDFGAGNPGALYRDSTSYLATGTGPTQSWEAGPQ